jgi:hypothetical protein
MKSKYYLKLFSIIALLVSTFIVSCRQRTPQINQRQIYTWVETKVYDQENDTIITIHPSNYQETYRMIIERNLADILSLVTIYKGDQVLLSSSLIDSYFATGDETDCYGEGFCYFLDCGYEICTRNWGDLDGEYTQIIYQFPFLDGNFHNGCNSSSLFKLRFEHY